MPISPITITQSEQHNGFALKNSITITEAITVLVGKNGAGKTRFFQSLKNNKSKVLFNDKFLDSNSEIILLAQNELNPQFSTHHDADSLIANITNTIRSYELTKSLFDLPYSEVHEKLMLLHGHGSGSGLRHRQLYQLVRLISQKTGKQPSQLSQEDIRLHYTQINENSLAGQNISSIFNGYAKRINDNQYNEWRNTNKGIDVPYYSDEDFKLKFGREPWITLNLILDDIFSGKFYFPPPKNLDSTTYDHRTPLMQNDGQEINSDYLSSGEKTLLWLALSLFNTQYHDRDLLSAPKLLLLDEPDAYLHPKMVVKMYEALSKFNEIFETRIILITHSPTTAALAPENSLFSVNSDGITSISKDAAISELLDGVTQISIDPENRRQVYVESFYDRKIFQLLFDNLKLMSSNLDGSISITFVSSGGKIPDEYLMQKSRSVFGINDENKIKEFVDAINGCGNCSQVYGIVESLTSIGATGVRGIVDWDRKNKSTKYISVCGEGYLYAIENIILDPICIMLQLHQIDGLKFSMERFCNKKIHWPEWLKDKDLLQTSMNNFLKNEMLIDSGELVDYEYVSGLVLKIDPDYLLAQGHNLEKRLLSKFPELKQIARQQNDGDLKYKIVQNIMIGSSCGKLIPKIILDTMRSLQN